MPSTYERHGLQFAYPENWELQEELGSDALLEVSLQSPDGGQWSLYAFADDRDVDESAQCVLRSLQADYESLEFEPVEEQYGGRATRGFDTMFFCLDFVVEAHIRAARFAGYVLVVLSQADDRQFQKSAAVFRAITFSLLNPSR